MSGLFNTLASVIGYSVLFIVIGVGLFYLIKFMFKNIEYYNANKKNSPKAKQVKDNEIDYSEFTKKPDKDETDPLDDIK